MNARSWTPVAAFVEQHEYPEGKGPQDVHPQGFGKIAHHAYLERDGWQVVVHSTERRGDGWSYCVAVERKEPKWFSYFRNHKTGARIRHLGLHGERLAHALGVKYDGLPL